MTKKNVDCFVWKDYDTLEARDTIKKLKQEIKSNGLSPTSTWMLEYGFNMFDEVYKAQGYTLVGLLITDTRKNNEATS